ncbi:MAG TPA: CaiB/BaiF CoA-transferase family protein [Candidatus Dormibacteraeota bacterium]
MLDGVRVLDLTRLLPGAYCTLLLADLGADVVKIEEPGRGDYMRWMGPLVGHSAATFNALNRNKRSVVLDLKSDFGRDAFLRLAGRADVVVEGNRPGVMDRLGVGWEVLRRRNAKLVLCSITGYGQDGPLARSAGHDLNYMAVAGALTLNGAPGGPPVPLGVQVADLGGGGMGAAIGIVAALYEVQRGGEGRHLDVAMMEGALAWTAAFRADAAAGGESPERGRGRLTGGIPCYRVYRCADGYLSVGALEPKFWKALCEALGRPDLVERQFAEGADGDAVAADVEAIFVKATRAEWTERLQGLEVCVEPVLEPNEVADHPQVRARGLIVETESGQEVRPAMGAIDGWRRRPPPALGEHTAEVLAEVGLEHQA